MREEGVECGAAVGEHQEITAIRKFEEKLIVNLEIRSEIKSAPFVLASKFKPTHFIKEYE